MNLKPCPFCGNRAEVVHAGHIRCINTYNCDCETRLGSDAWNRRPQVARPEASLSKAALLYAADIVQGLVRADEAGEIEETLRRLAAPLSDAEAGLLLPGLREAQRIAGSRPDGYEGILERIDELERKPQGDER